MTDYWPGLLSRIFYKIQFEPDLNKDLVDITARSLLTEPIDILTPDEEYSALASGLANNSPLPSLVPMHHSSHELREFLSEVVARMDEMRPWEEPGYLLLPESLLTEFQGSEPVARITLSTREIESRVRRIFHRRGFGNFLLLRMKSGAIVGMFSGYWEGSDHVMVASASSDHESGEVLNELVRAGNLDPTGVFRVDLPGTKFAVPITYYESVSIQSSFEGENSPENTRWDGMVVKYLSREERQEFRLRSKNGKLYDRNGYPYDTSSAKTLWSPGGGRAIFVMDHSGNLYSAPYHILGEFHHSSFLAGGPASGAGEIEVAHGNVRLISDQSSHYKPPRHITRQVVDSLGRQGIRISDEMVEYHAPPTA
ncbi:hypothetical protein [Nocardia callitridis]|uniref:hypothetical protein n=1 Tax=Nocardia callitridis TaxID=648753 RepID=UPI0031EF29C0